MGGGKGRKRGRSILIWFWGKIKGEEKILLCYIPQKSNYIGGILFLYSKKMRVQKRGEKEGKSLS